MLKVVTLLSFVATLVLAPFDGAAQFKTFMGSSSFTSQQFNCVTYPGGEDVEVTAKGKTRIVEVKEAKRLVKNSIQKITRKINDTKSDLKDTKALVKRLLKSPLLALPKVAKQLEQAKKRVVQLETKLEALKGQKSELASLVSAINNCGKIPPLTNGSNIILSGNVDLPISKRQGYLITAMHVFAYHPSMGDRICVSIDGGPRLAIGVRFNSCTNFADGSKPVSYCLPNLPAGQGGIPLGGKAGYFHLGYYEDDLSAVQDLLSTKVDLSLNSEENPCPRP